MAMLLRPVEADVSSALHRLRCDRIICRWRREIFVFALITVAITTLLSRTLLLFLSSASARSSFTVAAVNSSIDVFSLPFSRRRGSSLVPYPSNSSAEAFTNNRTSLITAKLDVAETNINVLREDFLHISTSKVCIMDFGLFLLCFLLLIISMFFWSTNNISIEIKSGEGDLKASAFVEAHAPSAEEKSSVSRWNVSASTGSGMHFEEVRTVNQWGEMNPDARSEIHAKVVKPSDGERKVPASTSYKRSRSIPPDEALIYAKKEIEGSHFFAGDSDLYAPLFLNVSIFKRSYELMEKILKVYIYRDGQRPIFHTPELKGIYASEGWFMKLIEQNRHFVVKDPGQAHLFYLPYSARRMELALYVPGSHDMKPLSRFLRDYVNQISSKYPFWNRTRGSDHFLVACHDWGPYTTTMHDELRKNTIKALCNADASEGIFIRGKDVSLPETTIRTPRRPLRYVGGRPASQRLILAFFAGFMHGRVRPILLEHWGNGKDEDMRIYGPLSNQISKKMSYIEHMKSSKFCICPMGFEVNSPRIVEAIYYECVPVIIADNFVLPFEEVLDWSKFSVIVAEKDIPKLKDILLGIPFGQYLKMQECVKRLQKHFLWHSRPEKYDLFHMILHSIWSSRLNHI